VDTEQHSITKVNDDETVAAVHSGSAHLPMLLVDVIFWKTCSYITLYWM